MAAAGGRVGSLQRPVDPSEHARKIPINLVAPESQHPKSFLLEVMVTRAISQRVLIEIVLAAIDFNNQMMLKTDKVHDEVIAR